MDNQNQSEHSKTPMGKRILAWIGIGLIGLWILITVVVAIFPVPNKEKLFPFFMFGCIIFPIFLWIAMWIYGAVTGKKNVASFRSAEMEEVMKKAEEIRAEEEAKAETGAGEAKLNPEGDED